MKEMRVKKGLVAICMLLVLVCISVCNMKVYATSDYTKKVTKKNENFTVDAQYGMDGLVFYDTPTMVSVSVECKENFTGMLRIIPGSYYGSSIVAYGADISLSAGEAKTFQFVPTVIGNNGQIIIQILDEKNKVIYQETDTIIMESSGSKVIVGVLSDDYSALSYFDGLGINVDSNQAISSVFELTKENFPEDAKALSMMHYMIIDNFDTSTLSEEQYSALKSWVKNGGVLILGLGSNYQSVLNCFDDSFVSGTLGNLDKRTVTWDVLKDATATVIDYDTKQQTTEMSMAEDTEVTTEEGSTEDTAVTMGENTMSQSGVSLTMDCIEFQLEDGEPFSQETTADSASVKDVGLGRVVVLAYSLAMEPMTSAGFNDSIAKFLIENASVSATVDKFYGNDVERSGMYSGIEVAKLADTSSKPSVLLYGFILLAYVILVGPILYVILKTMNKREKIWIAIPIVTLAFTAVIYLTGFMYRINKPLVSTFTVVQLDDNAKSERIYTNILCPKPKQYTIQFAEGYTGFRKNQDSYTIGMFDVENDDTTFDYMIKENSKGTEILLDNNEPFQETSFLLNHSGENNIGSIDSDLKCMTTGFEGTVTNNTCYDLQDLVVTFESYLCLVGDVKKGETVTIDTSKVVVTNPYGSFEKLYPEKQLYVDREMFLRFQMNNMIETNVIDKDAYQTGYIWASIPSYKPEVVDGSNVKRAGCGVLVTSYTAKYADVSGTYYPSIDSLGIASQGDYDFSDRSIYSAEVVITYSFEGSAGITELQNRASEDSSSYTYATPAEVYAYNVETGNYDQIFTTSNILNGEELKKYMLDDVIVLKYMQSSNGYLAYIPRISAKGDQ